MKFVTFKRSLATVLLGSMIVASIGIGSAEWVKWGRDYFSGKSIYAAAYQYKYPVKGIKFKAEEATIAVDDRYFQFPKITPRNASNKTIAWKTSDPAVATVSFDGVVAGIAAGTAKISAVTKDGSYTATYKINVVQGITQITPSTSSVSLKVKGKSAVKLSLTPKTAYSKSITWSSTNPAVATVDASGTIIGVKKGTTKIQVIDTLTDTTSTVNVTVK